RPQKSAGDPELVDDGIGRWQMLEIVAHEHDIHRCALERIKAREPAASEKPHLGIEMFPNVTEVHGPALARLDLVDEVPAVTGDVENGRRRRDVALEKARDLAPDGNATRRIFIGE